MTQRMNFRRLVGGLGVMAVAVLVLSWAGAPIVKADPNPDEFVCFPTCGTDARFLTIATQGVNSLVGTDIFVSLNAAAEALEMTLGVFDGENGGLWDNPLSTQVKFDVYADPLGDTSGYVVGTELLTLNGATMPDNGWQDFTLLNNTDAQSCTTCAFRYLLRISAVNPFATGSTYFKIRTMGTLGLRANPFAFEAPMPTVATARIIYPNWPASGPANATHLTPTVYDGTWRFGFSVPDPGAKRITVWDGDLDFGPRDCSVRDTDDPDSVAFPTAFLVSPATLAEGVPTTGQVCANSADGISTGNPSDSTNVITYRREPLSGLGNNLLYRLFLPDGSALLNKDPSGNLEWEQFVVDGDAAVAFDRSQMDYKVPALAPGVYEVFIEGVDLSNLNAYRFQFNLLGLPPNGPPAPEDAFYRIERYVWYDTDNDGLFDTDEQGIPGVTVVRTDTVSGNVQTAVTGSDGLFIFRVPQGTYSLTVVDGNFDAGRPLNGLRFTGGNGYGATGEFVGNLMLGAGNPYERRDFGYVANTPPVAGNDDAGLCLCTGSTTIDVLANDTDPDNNTLTVSAITQPTHGTATLNADNTVSYVPTGGYTGPDSFTYTVDDGRGGTATGTVTLDVINNLSVLLNDSATTSYQTPVTVDVLANDSDPDGQALAIAFATQGANGSTAVNANGTITYTPNAGFSGTDTFTYTVSDGCGVTMATVTITVDPQGVCYVGSRNPNVGASQTWVSNANGTMTLRTTLSQSFNDNTYGANQVGWPGRNHKFSHLVTSDMVQLALFDKNGARKMEFKLDYFSASTASPTGWQSLGTWGGDGAMILGSQAHIVSADSSLAVNFRQGPSYILTKDSPAIPNTTHPNWIFEVWYEVTVDPAAFGAAGFGRPSIVAIHASPSKTGVETEPLTEVDCVGNITPANHDGGSPSGTSGGNASGKGKK